MAAYPLYIVFSTGGQSVESKEDFLSLEKKKIFTEELMTSVSQADETALTPSQAGFILTKEAAEPTLYLDCTTASWLYQESIINRFHAHIKMLPSRRQDLFLFLPPEREQLFIL